MFAQQMQFMLPGTQLQPITTFPVTPSLATSPTMAFSPYLSHVSPGMGLVPAELLPNTPVLVSGNPTVTVPGGSAGQKLMRTDKLEVCREFQRGNCTRGENDCRYAHPIDIAMIDTNENTVTVCMDYIKGRCSREKCKYFHPPAHLQAKIKAAQHQVNQTAAAAMALPPGALQPLPKRPALEKNNGATTVFNPSVFHYQQALANMQLQQPTFIPTGILQFRFFGCPEDILRDWFNKGSKKERIYGQALCQSRAPIVHAHDARCYAHHCVCSNNSCHQRPLRCNSYRQSADHVEILNRKPTEHQDFLVGSCAWPFCIYPLLPSIVLYHLYSKPVAAYMLTKN
ncbi:UNVERIFIED_CONTAM: hypothetical protein H355_011091 [Colinus virginianus]|nr:hypothetical protein H355_011091 [Colinus virginianus]